MIKNILFTLGLFLFPGTTSAQFIEFAPAGAVWTYYRTLYDFTASPETEEVEVRYTDDVWIDSLLCKRLSAPEGDYYIYQVDNKVYHRRDTAAQFSLLWDFDVMPGDTFSTISQFPWDGSNYFNYVCTARDTVFQNGIPLPRIYLDVLCPGGELWTKNVVNPRYGPMPGTAQHCADYLLNTYLGGCIFDFGYFFELTKYTDNLFPTVHGCVVGVDAPSNLPAFSVYPNPVSEQLYFVNVPDNAILHLFDSLGRLVLTTKNTDNKWDISALHAGIYTVEISSANRSKELIRICKTE